MAGKLSNVGDQVALDIAFGRAIPAWIGGTGTTTSRTMYVCLLSAAPSDSSTLATMTEISTSGYARQAVTPANWANGGTQPYVLNNAALITFGPFNATTPSVGWAALGSAASGTTGDMTATWTLTTAKTANQYESMQIAIGQLSMSQA